MRHLVFFITICAKDRAQIFWENVAADIIRQNHPKLSNAGKIVDMAIQQISKHYPQASVDKYCIMPDYVHMILHITADAYGQPGSAKTIGIIAGQMKRWASKQIGSPIWQKSFIDRVIRNEKGYLATREYIENNPVKMDFADDGVDFLECSGG